MSWALLILRFVLGDVEAKLYAGGVVGQSKEATDMIDEFVLCIGVLLIRIRPRSSKACVTSSLK